MGRRRREAPIRPAIRDRCLALGISPPSGVARQRTAAGDRWCLLSWWLRSRSPGLVPLGSDIGHGRESYSYLGQGFCQFCREGHAGMMLYVAAPRLTPEATIAKEGLFDGVSRRRREGFQCSWLNGVASAGGLILSEGRSACLFRG